MNIVPIKLHRFCNIGGGKYDRPMRLLGGTCATNHSLLVWVAAPYDYERPEKEETERALEKMVSLASGAAPEGGTWRDVADISIRGLDCWTCQGRGHINARRCSDRNGGGEISEPAKESSPACHACFGTGLECGVTDFHIKGFPDYSANQRLVALLRELPRAQLRQEPLFSKTNEPMIAVRFDGGVGVLMSVKGKPLNAEQAAAAQGGAT